MKHLAIAAALAASFLPAQAEYQLRIIDGDHAYYDTVANLTWVDGVRTFRYLSWDDPGQSWNDVLYTNDWYGTSSVAQLTALNHEIQAGGTFQRILQLGPFGGSVNRAWTNEPWVPCRGMPPTNPTACLPVPVGETPDHFAPVVYNFGPGDGSFGPFVFDFGFRLTPRMFVGDVGTPISAVPEPESWALLVLGLTAVVARGRRNQSTRKRS